MRGDSFRRDLRKGASMLKNMRRGRAKSGKTRGGRGVTGRFRKLRGVRPYVVYICVATVIIVAVITLSMLISPVRWVRVRPRVVAAFQIPHRNILTLRMLANRHALDFPEVLAVYALENSFFAIREDISPPEAIEHMFIAHYDQIRASFRRSDILIYEEMFRNILTELSVFPIPIGFDDAVDPSYMYGDSFAVSGMLLANPRSGGTNIYDRENVPGRIPIVAAAPGTVLRARRTGNHGYRVQIRGERGTIFTYSHLYSIAEGVIEGQAIIAGEILGFMGNSGFTGPRNARRQVPVRLRMTIAPQTRLSLGAFYINPYPFLRLMEDYRVDFRHLRFDPAHPQMFPPHIQPQIHPQMQPHIHPQVPPIILN